MGAVAGGFHAIVNGGMHLQHRSRIQTWFIPQTADKSILIKVDARWHAGRKVDSGRLACDQMHAVFQFVL